MSKNNISHLAFILDGNKRWADKHKLSEVYGYKKGFDNITTLVDYSLKINLSNLTLFTLSSENFKRPSINIIYEIIYSNFSNLIDKIIKKNNIKINIFGIRDNLPKKISNIFDEAEKVTINNNNSLNLNLAFNYGFKIEIREVLKKYKSQIETFDLNNQDEIDNLFFLSSLSDPDILIRTGGYQRLSNFIMYNLTYTELYFTETLWPDFTIDELNIILNKFSKVHRKYGL